MAAFVSILALALAALTRSASAGREAEVDADPATALPNAGTDLMPICLATEMEPVSPVDFTAMERGEDTGTGPRAQAEDLGRIGLGPGPLDLSRFFETVDQSLDLPDLPSRGAAGHRGAHLGMPDLPDLPQGAGAAVGPAAPEGTTGGGGGSGPATGGGGSGAGGGSGTGSAGDGGSENSGGPETTSHVHFEDLFAMLASIAHRFQPATVRDISTAAIGDWISQHELYRLQGVQGPQAPDAAFHQREERTAQLLADPGSRDAFIRQHFPSADFTDPGACRPVTDHYHVPMPEDGFDTETYATLL